MTDENQVVTEDRTFTQAEVDAIVGDRLKRERSKYADYDAYKAKAEKFDEIEEASKTELQKATDRANELQKELDSLKSINAIREMRANVSRETGVPESVLSGSTEEECREQAKNILEFAKPSGYPNVRDGGELPTAPIKKTTRDQFAEWSEKLF